MTDIRQAAPSEPEKFLSYGCYSIRIAWRDGVPFFVAADVIVALKLKIGPKTTVASRINFLREGPSRTTAVLATFAGPVVYDIISAHGAKQLCKSRKGKTAEAVSKFLAYHAARLTPKKPKVLKPTDARPDGPLPLNDCRIRFVIINGLPWYSLADFAGVLGMKVERTIRERVPAIHLRTASIPTDAGGTEEAPVLSPIGAWQLALQENGCLRELAHKWVFKETKLIAPDAFDRTLHGASQMMALLPGGDLPPRPHLRSGRVSEWEDLRNSNALRTYQYGVRSVVHLLPRLT